VQSRQPLLPIDHHNIRGKNYYTPKEGDVSYADQPNHGQAERHALTGMAKALTEQMEMQDLNSLTFDERLGLMVDREMLDREDRRLATRLRKAKLRVPACMEDIDFRHKRGLDKSLVMSLAGCQWIKGRQNLIITGPTGVGKTYLACALVHKACLMGTPPFTAACPICLREITIARADGSYPKKMAAYAKTSLIALDDWGLDRLTREQSLDLLELWKTATASNPPWWPPKCQSTTGMRSSAIPPWPMPSWTAWCTALTRYS
jgi:DNA replication protein DnaC